MPLVSPLMPVPHRKGIWPVEIPSVAMPVVIILLELGADDVHMLHL